MSPALWVLVLAVACTLIQLHCCLDEDFPNYGDYEENGRSLKKKKKKLQCLLHLFSQQRSLGEERTFGLLGAITQFETHQDDQDYGDDPCGGLFHGHFTASSAQSFQNRDRNSLYGPQTYVRQLNRLLRPVNRALRPIYRVVF